MHPHLITINTINQILVSRPRTWQLLLPTLLALYSHFRMETITTTTNFCFAYESQVSLFFIFVCINVSLEPHIILNSINLLSHEYMQLHFTENSLKYCFKYFYYITVKNQKFPKNSVCEICNRE